MKQIVIGCVLVSIGLVCGWFAASQGQTSKSDEEAEAGETGALSAQTLKNIGVTLGPAKLTQFTRNIRVQATVVDAPLNARPVAAPLGGIVKALHVKPGNVVKAGAPIVTLVREPIARPKLELTNDILSPVSEKLHEAASTLRSAVGRLTIVRAELERVAPFVKDETLPLKTQIELEYELKRAEREVANARNELQWHGLGEEEIASVEKGAAPPASHTLWQRALQRNGLWKEIEDRLLAALPAATRARPWSIAAIGELSAAGLATKQLVTALHEVPHLAEHFVESASMLLTGSSVSRVRSLGEAGAFAADMVLRAPAGADDYDIAEVEVRVGESVDAGQSVALLHNPREMWLRVEPLGGEINAIGRALKAGTALTAMPLLSGTGPTLKDLRVARLDTRGTQEERGGAAFVVCRNETAVTGATRSWKLRVGLRYLLLVPDRVYTKCFVFPAGAVTETGPDRIVFLEDGDTFRDEPVHVMYEDDEVVLIQYDGKIAPGDKVVLTGAFALGLAMQTGSGAIDPHAGHNH